MTEDLHDRQIRSLAESILLKNYKVTFFLGAGVSTASGIPDFRSPGTGIYDNLAQFNLPYAEAIFTLDYFKQNPEPFCVLAEELYPGNYRPTVFHCLLKLFEDKGILQRVYTQNIDNLERVAGVSDEFIVEAHGSFAEAHCVSCRKSYTSQEVWNKLIDKAGSHKGIPHCSCGNYIKPDIVFFGEALPQRLFNQWDEDVEDVDVAIVAGTSLTVYPFALLPSEVPRRTRRMLVNYEKVGDFVKGRRTDIFISADCDTIANKLAAALGWEQDLKDLVEKVLETHKEYKQKRKKEQDEVKPDDVTKETTKEADKTEAKQKPKQDKAETKQADETNSKLDKPELTDGKSSEEIEDKLSKLNL